MNLVILTAVIAVCGAAKLDRTYLPPASAKTAGGSPGSLQTPFSGNSLNNGLGGLPKGSYENDFQGVVVDAAAAGTRASEPGETGLGAARISYGSTDSRVGAAAFKTRPSAFSPEQPEGQAQGFQGTQSFPTGATNAAFQQSFSDSLQSGALVLPPNSAFQQQTFSGPERQRASLDRSASIVRYESEVGPENYHFAFETDNGISAEENGVATNGVQAQGGFSYTGDDGQVYSVTYTADEGGYQPKGDHLPTPPPIPEEILKSLEQNARDEAAGLTDDGTYDVQRYNAGSDYAENEGANGKYTHQSSKFDGADTDTSFLNKNQASGRPTAGQSSFNAQAGQSSKGQTPNRYTQEQFGSTSDGNDASLGQGFNAQFGQSSQSLSGQFQQADSKLSNDVSASGQTSVGPQTQVDRFGSFSGTTSQSGSKQGQPRPGLGNRNEYLPPVNSPNVRPQTGRPQNSRLQNSRPQTGRPQAATDESQPTQEPSNDEESPIDAIPLGQQSLQGESRPQLPITSFGKPISSGILSQNKFESSRIQARPTNGRKPSLSDNFVQGQSSQPGRPNEYLPPTTTSLRPSNGPQPSGSFTSQFNQQTEDTDTGSEVVKPQDQIPGIPNSLLGSQSSFGSQQLDSFQRPQPSRPDQNGNRFSSAPAQSTFGLTDQKTTAQPATELTTPLETSNDDSIPQSGSQSTASDFTSSQKFGRPTQASFTTQNQYNGPSGFSSSPSRRPQTSRPQSPRPFEQTQKPTFPNQSTIEQFNQNAQLFNRPQSQSTFGQNGDAQFSSSTQRPSYTGQPQGPDDSYYYNQPSRPFGIPQASRFPSAPSDQFDRVMQQPSFGQNQFQNVPSTDFSSSGYQGSTKYPRPPTIAPTSPTSQIQGQFGNNYVRPASNKYPQPPTLAPTSPTASAQSKYQGNNVNGVTQASISPFPSPVPTQTSQGQIGSRPTFQQSQFSQISQSASSPFSQQPTKPSFSQQSSASASFPKRPNGLPSLQSQAQTQTFGQQPESQDQISNEKNEKPVPSQQYAGEIYEYNKPAMTLPPPDNTPVSPSKQFGQKIPAQGQISQTQPQFGQTSDEEDQRPVSQFGGQSPVVQGSRPQFNSKPKPQFGQNSFGAPTQQTEEDSKPFGALAQSQAMFGQSKPQYSQTQSTFSQIQGSQKPVKPEAEVELSSGEEPQPQGPKNQFGFVSACCEDNASRKPAKNQFGSQSQFSQPAFAGAQKQPSTFVGQGEQFGGPRKPPSFDDETGYHY